jgi:hypothetical protein
MKKQKRIDELTKFIALDQMGYTYDDVTGIVTSPKGKEIGGTKNGWVYFFSGIEIDGKIEIVQTYAHRFAYWYMTGDIPEAIDHIDRNRANNRWSNLRSSNAKHNATNRSPVRGFIIDNKINGTKYIAHSFVGGTREILGHFDSPVDAFIFSHLFRKGCYPVQSQIDSMLESL